MADYVFTVKLFDNEIQDDNERYSTDCLEKLAELFIGQPGYIDGRYVAKITSATVVEELDKRTRTGDIYCWVKAEVTIEITHENANLISKISRGICRELRTACTVRRRTCSICGEEIANCEHTQGEIYDSMLCFVILDDPINVCGWKLVDRKTPEDESNTARVVNGNRGMNRPRICEVLGVEEGEYWDFKNGDISEIKNAFILPDGIVRSGCGDLIDVNALCDAINHPDRIIRRPKQGQDRDEADKPFKEWTLSEVSEWCDKYRNRTEKPCEQTCPIYRRGICKLEWVHDWDLEEMRCFTEQETKDAKDISRCLRDASKVARYSNAVVWVLDPSGKELARVKDGMFPSILQGMEYTLDEMVKST